MEPFAVICHFLYLYQLFHHQEHTLWRAMPARCSYNLHHSKTYSWCLYFIRWISWLLESIVSKGELTCIFPNYHAVEVFASVPPCRWYGRVTARGMVVLTLKSQTQLSPSAGWTRNIVDEPGMWWVNAPSPGEWHQAWRSFASKAESLTPMNASGCLSAGSLSWGWTCGLLQFRRCFSCREQGEGTWTSLPLGSLQPFIES